MISLGRLRPWPFSLGVITLLVSNCATGLAGWHRPPTPLPTHFEPRQQVQLWHEGRSTLWHGVKAQGDTLTGIPYHRPLECSTCLQCIPLAAIDSVRLGSIERVGWVVAASPWLLGAALLIYLRESWGSD